MSRDTVKRKICADALKRFPNTPILTLAKKIYEEYPMHFSTLEHARSAIKYYAGLKGDRDRKKIKSKDLLREKTYNYSPFDDIPDPYNEEIEHYILDKSVKKIMVLSDIHFPYHDKTALKAAVNHGIKENVDCIILNGDILDFYSLSDFSKDPSKPTFRAEIELGKWFLTELRKAFPKAKIYYKIGNHEMRLERYLKVKAPEIFDSEEFKLSILLEFAKNNVILVDKYSIIKAGNLNIIHGHEYRGSGGVYPAKYIYNKTKENTLCGHYHRSSVFMDKSINGEYKGGFSTGCLCSLTPEYMPYNEWVHGFAIVYMKDNGEFNVNNIVLHKGKIK